MAPGLTSLETSQGARAETPGGLACVCAQQACLSLDGLKGKTVPESSPLKGDKEGESACQAPPVFCSSNQGSPLWELMPSHL